LAYLPSPQELMFLWWRADARNGRPDTIPSFWDWWWGSKEATGEDNPELQLTAAPGAYTSSSPYPPPEAPGSPPPSPGRLLSFESGDQIPSPTQVIGWANRPSPPIDISETQQEFKMLSALASMSVEDKPTEITMVEFEMWKILEQNRLIGREVAEELEELKVLGEFLRAKLQAQTRARASEARKLASSTKQARKQRQSERIETIKEITQQYRKVLEQRREQESETAKQAAIGSRSVRTNALRTSRLELLVKKQASGAEVRAQKKALLDAAKAEAKQQLKARQWRVAIIGNQISPRYFADNGAPMGPMEA